LITLPASDARLRRNYQWEIAMKTSWSIRAWPPLLWQAEDAAPLQFNHVDTQVFTTGGDDVPLCGQTVWSGPVADGEVGVAWDWVQLSRGVVAMADPMSVVSNLRLLGPQGEVLTAWESARHLSQIVYGLPWQGEVQRVLRHLND
jgi:hypothetical protein